MAATKINYIEINFSDDPRRLKLSFKKKKIRDTA